MMGPSERDLEIWKRVQVDNQERLYKGLSGIFQRAGHWVIGRWARNYVDGVVLEVGCGAGHHLRHGGNGYRRYVGLDIRRCQLVEFSGRRVQGDGYALPFADGSVDCVLSIYCLEHLKRLAVALDEVRRVLRPGGAFLVGVPIENWLYKLGRWLFTARYARRRWGIDYVAIAEWEHGNPFREMVRALDGRFDRRGFVGLGVIGCLRYVAV